jgi:predicted RNase H-like nuclease (RuvC/YqgF family)
MSISPVILQYVVPAIIAAVAAALVGVIPYFMTRRETRKEKGEADKTAVETARLMYDGLALRIEQLEKENQDLRAQLNMMQRQNAYLTDLEAAKYQLEAHVEELTGRINTLEQSLRVVIDAFKEYMINPVPEAADKMLVLLKDIEGQIKIRPRIIE